MNNKAPNMGVPIGTSLLLVVFVLLALITFATLSYVSADTDNKLSQNVADATTAYYKAEEAAQTTLMQIHAVVTDTVQQDIQKQYEELSNILRDYNIVMRDDKVYISYETIVSDVESLYSEIEVLPNGDFNIIRWQLLYTEEWESNNEFPVFL